MTKNNHKIISHDKYGNGKARVVVFCKKHNKQFQTTFANYKKCRYGLECCGEQSVKDLHLKQNVMKKVVF